MSASEIGSFPAWKKVFNDSFHFHFAKSARHSDRTLLYVAHTTYTIEYIHLHFTPHFPDRTFHCISTLLSHPKSAHHRSSSGFSSHGRLAVVTTTKTLRNRASPGEEVAQLPPPPPTSAPDCTKVSSAALVTIAILAYDCASEEPSYTRPSRAALLGPTLDLRLGRQTSLALRCIQARLSQHTSRPPCCRASHLECTSKELRRPDYRRLTSSAVCTTTPRLHQSDKQGKSRKTRQAREAHLPVRLQTNCATPV